MSSAETGQLCSRREPGRSSADHAQTVRVIMIDHDRTLLFEDSDPGVRRRSGRLRRGGQIEADETMIQAAIREVAEGQGTR